AASVSTTSGGADGGGKNTNKFQEQEGHQNIKTHQNSTKLVDDAYSLHSNYPQTKSIPAAVQEYKRRKRLIRKFDSWKKQVEHYLYANAPKKKPSILAASNPALREEESRYSLPISVPKVYDEDEAIFHFTAEDDEAFDHQEQHKQDSSAAGGVRSSGTIVPPTHPPLTENRLRSATTGTEGTIGSTTVLRSDEEEEEFEKGKPQTIYRIGYSTKSSKITRQTAKIPVRWMRTWHNIQVSSTAAKGGGHPQGTTTTTSRDQHRAAGGVGDPNLQGQTSPTASLHSSTGGAASGRYVPGGAATGTTHQRGAFAAASAANNGVPASTRPVPRKQPASTTNEWIQLQLDSHYHPDNPFHLSLEWILCSNICAAKFTLFLVNSASENGFLLQTVPHSQVFPQPSQRCAEKFFKQLNKLKYGTEEHLELIKLKQQRDEHEQELANMEVMQFLFTSKSSFYLLRNYMQKQVEDLVYKRPPFFHRLGMRIPERIGYAALVEMLLSPPLNLLLIYNYGATSSSSKSGSGKSAKAALLPSATSSKTGGDLLSQSRSRSGLPTTSITGVAGVLRGTSSVVQPVSYGERVDLNINDQQDDLVTARETLEVIDTDTNQYGGVDMIGARGRETVVAQAGVAGSAGAPDVPLVASGGETETAGRSTTSPAREQDNLFDFDNAVPMLGGLDLRQLTTPAPRGTQATPVFEAIRQNQHLTDGGIIVQGVDLINTTSTPPAQEPGLVDSGGPSAAPVAGPPASVGRGVEDDPIISRPDDESVSAQNNALQLPAQLLEQDLQDQYSTGNVSASGSNSKEVVTPNDSTVMSLNLDTRTNANIQQLDHDGLFPPLLNTIGGNTSSANSSTIGATTAGLLQNLQTNSEEQLLDQKLYHSAIPQQTPDLLVPFRSATSNSKQQITSGIYNSRGRTREHQHSATAARGSFYDDRSKTGDLSPNNSP
ncbi:unnamed protein product, partial [Amoebophrya sp. A120]